MCFKLLPQNHDNEELLKQINLSESYLKARFQTHCKYNDSCRTHCINYALSHPNDNDFFSRCEQNHDQICGECLNVINCIAAVKSKISQITDDRQREVTTYEIGNAEQKIMDWQKHVIRGVQQAKARANALNNLQQSNGLWIRDFAQKYNPNKVRIFYFLRFHVFNQFTISSDIGGYE